MSPLTIPPDLYNRTVTIVRGAGLNIHNKIPRHRSYISICPTRSLRIWPASSNPSSVRDTSPIEFAAFPDRRALIWKTLLIWGYFEKAHEVCLCIDTVKWQRRAWATIIYELMPEIDLQHAKKTLET